MTAPVRLPPKSLDGRSARELFAYERTAPNGDPSPPPAVASGGMDVDLTIHDDAVTLTNLPSGETDYIDGGVWYDPRGANQMRVVIKNVEVAGSAGSKIVAKYGAGSDPGTSEVSAPIDSTGPQKSASWVALDPASIADLLWYPVGAGGNGTADPVVRGVHFQFRAGGVINPCGDGGCPMPADIYNGEDFSSYADEADFLSFVEAESNKFYYVWYGDDGSVEGCSFAPGVTFCGNPVVRGRWKAVASGNPLWDVIGWGSFTRFANPIGGALVSFTEVWATLRFRIESGWTSWDSPGFVISDLQSGGGGTGGTYRVLLKAGRVVLRARADSSLGSEVEYDMGPASLIVGTAGFMEVTLHGRIVPNASPGLYDVTVEAFVNPACSNGVAGEINTATPLATYSVTGMAASARPKFFDWDKFNSTSSGQWPEKYIDVAQAFYSGSLT